MVYKTDLEKFHASYSVEPGGCWVWQKAISRAGYAVMRLKFDPRPRAVNAHRWGYIQLVGPIPEGQQIDHLCRNRACVNPAHLEPVTSGENTIRGQLTERKEYCSYGHPMFGDNVSDYANGKRRCSACKRRSNRERWERDGDYLRAYYRSYFRERRNGAR